MGLRMSNGCFWVSAKLHLFAICFKYYTTLSHEKFFFLKDDVYEIVKVYLTLLKRYFEWEGGGGGGLTLSNS
jgi:hypothetical protein